VTSAPRSTEVRDPLLTYRGRFPILAHSNYLISNSLGAVPSAASRALEEYYNDWANRGVRAWEEKWWTMVVDLGNLVAPLIGADAGTIAFQPTVTLAHAVVFSAFDFTKGRTKIVTDEMHFPSIRYLLAELEHSGARLTTVPSDDGVVVDTQRVMDAIDEQTAFVNISHVLFKSAYVHDVRSITDRAREVGAYAIVDGYQSVGTIPIDVNALGIDIYIGGTLKWLCGGPGNAFLWVRPDLQPKLSPRLTGWMAHKTPFDFADRMDRKTDIWRYLNGTPNISGLYAARPGLEIINEIGVDAIRSKSVRQTERLLSLADARGFRCTTPRDPAQRGGTVAVGVPNGYAVSKALKAREIICDYRPGAGIRLSPHFYTRDDELDAAIDAIADIIETNAWRPFSSQQSVVT
jgi:kynureninase